MDVTCNALCKSTIQETKEDGDKGAIPRENKWPQFLSLAWLTCQRYYPPTSPGQLTIQ